MPTIERPIRLSFLCHAAIWSMLFQLIAIAQVPPPAPPASAPGTTPAPGLRVTPPSVTEPADPSLPPLPQPPEPPNVPLPEQLYIPNLGTGPGLIMPLPPPGSSPHIAPLQRVHRVGKIVIKYGTDVRKRFPKLPSEEQLGGTVIPLLQDKFFNGEGLFHIPKPNDERADKNKPDYVLHPEGVLPPGAAVPKPAPADKSVRVTPGAKVEAKDKKVAAKDSGKSATKSDAKPAATETGKIVPMKVSDFGEPRWLSAMGLLDIYDAIVDRITERGLIGVYLLTTVIPRTGADLRKETLDIEVEIFVSEVAKVRTISRRVPFKTGDEAKLNDDDAPDGQAIKDPTHAWIKAKSPRFVGGGLLQKNRLQDYLNRLNRFPERRVDAAINATGEPGKIMLDYIIREEKPLTVYFHEANDGTKSTGEWRSRVGLQWLQLANMDDILRIEYVTTDFSSYNAATLSYQFALDKPDVLKMRLYGTYGNYSAEDVGFALLEFKGETVIGGAAITWTPFYLRGFPIDFTLGGEFMRATVDSPAAGQTFSGNFLLPYVGFGTERYTDRYSFATNVDLKASFGGPDADHISGLGRSGPNKRFYLLEGGLEASTFLEPLLLGSKWGDLGRDGEKWWHGMLANELAVLARGQYTFSDRRLIPQMEFVSGGYNTVRGYPEAFTSGDSAYVTSLEYRLHVPRLFKPANVPQKTKGAKPPEKPGVPNQAAPVTTTPVARGGKSGTGFHFVPPTAGTSPDWDFIFRIFGDCGQTFNNRIQTVVEKDRTLVSVGAGVEFQLLRPFVMTLRADYGIALRAERDLVPDPVDAGDTRLHLSGTIAW